MTLSPSRLVPPITLILATGLLFIVGSTMRPVHATSLGPVTTDIDALLQDPRIIRRVTAWGVSIHDIRHDVSAMSPAERVQLAYVLSRQWQSTTSQPQPAQQAQFLVMMSLMRESTLFASVISTGNSKFTQ